MRLNTFFLALVCAATVFALAQGGADPAVQSKIIALEKAWNQAYKLGDKRALDTLLDNGIVLVNDDGSVQTKAEFLASIKQSNSEEQQVSPESISVHMFGHSAIATGVFRAKATDGGKPYVRRDRFVDTWINKDGQWVCVAASAITVQH
jgi:ketosteroid isomerase-like protein